MKIRELSEVKVADDDIDTELLLVARRLANKMEQLGCTDVEIAQWSNSVRLTGIFTRYDYKRTYLGMWIAPNGEIGFGADPGINLAAIDPQHNVNLKPASVDEAIVSLQRLMKLIGLKPRADESLQPAALETVEERELVGRRIANRMQRMGYQRVKIDRVGAEDQMIRVAASFKPREEIAHMLKQDDMARLKVAVRERDFVILRTHMFDWEAVSPRPEIKLTSRSMEEVLDNLEKLINTYGAST